jgi:hypothetical protein
MIEEGDGVVKPKKRTVAKAFQFLECTTCHVLNPAPIGRRCPFVNKGLPSVVEVDEPDDDKDDVPEDTGTPAVHSEGLGHEP